MEQSANIIFSFIVELIGKSHFLLFKTVVLLAELKNYCVCPSVLAPPAAKLFHIPAEPEGTMSTQLTLRRCLLAIPVALLVSLSLAGT